MVRVVLSSSMAELTGGMREVELAVGAKFTVNSFDLQVRYAHD